MDKQMTLSAFSDELAQVRTKKKEFLNQIERIVPWKEWLAMIQPCYYKGERGNKPYPLEIMRGIRYTFGYGSVSFPGWENFCLTVNLLPLPMGEMLPMGTERALSVTAVP